jgi:hypothetical protein
MVLLVDKAQVETHFGPFGDSANLDTQSLCTVRAEHTISVEIVLHAPDESPR